MKKAGWILAFALCLGACTHQEKQQAKEDLKDAGQAVKKELKQDAAFMKEQALKAREATQKGVKKIREDLKSDPHKDTKNE